MEFFYIDDAQYQRMVVNLGKQLERALEREISSDTLRGILWNYTGEILKVFASVYVENLPALREREIFNKRLLPIKIKISQDIFKSFIKKKCFDEDGRSSKTIKTLVDMEMGKTLPIMYKLQKTRPVKLA